MIRRGRMKRTRIAARAPARAPAWTPALALGFALAGAHASAAGFVKLTKTGEDVLTTCNPGNSPANTACKVTSLPGVSGYGLVAARSAPLIYNGIMIGTLDEKVWRKDAHPNRYIFGARLTMNANQWDSSGAAFNVNDVFRQTRPGKPVSIAYHLDGATKALKKAGRTVQGLNEFEEDEPERDNTWVGFRIDANAAELEGPSSAKSPWLLARTRAPEGIELNMLGLRVLNSDVEEVLDAVDFYTASYQPVGVPPPEDEDDEDEEGGEDE
jgi:hypothetical protein